MERPHFGCGGCCTLDRAVLVYAPAFLGPRHMADCPLRRICLLAAMQSGMDQGPQRSGGCLSDAATAKADALTARYIASLAWR